MNQNKKVSAKKVETLVLEISQGGATALTFRLYVTQDQLGDDIGRAGDVAFHYGTNTITFRDKYLWNNISTFSLGTGSYVHPLKPGHLLGFELDSTPIWCHQDEWMPPTFNSVKEIVSRYVKGLERHLSEPEPVISCSTSNKRRREGDPEPPKQNRPQESKDPLRFINSSRGFPSHSPVVEWYGGLKTYAPFVGANLEQDHELVAVKDMASRLIPGYETENTSELVTFLELDEVLRNPKDHPTEQIYESTSRLASQIRSNMAESRAVVVRGWNRDLPSDFTHESLALHVGDLGQPAQWGDGMIIARNRDLPEPVSYHKTSSLEEFVSRIDLTDVCGNWLDGKNVHPTPPFFSIPILDSTMAWNHTFRILCESKQKNHTINHAQSPETVRAANWSAPGWRLVTHPGFLTWPHFDCCGFATYVVAEEGCKLWGVMRPRAEECNSEWKKVPELYQKIQVTGQDGRYPCDMEVIVLERGDVLFQPPSVMHMVYTPTPSIFTGGYFFAYETMHLTRLALFLHKTRADFTNDTRAGTMRTLSRMMIALRYRSKSRVFGKRSLLSFILIFMKGENGNGTDYVPSGKTCVQLVREETGDFLYAKRCAREILEWLGITVKAAEEYVVNHSTYLTAGKETVEIPARVPWSENDGMGLPSKTK